MLPAPVRDRLEIHRALLAQWTARINLIGPNELAQYWPRHALDCAQLLPLVPNAKTWIDLGAGAGFPGLILAAQLADTPGAQVTLVESNQKKAAFLREAARAMAVPAIVRAERVEAVIAGGGAYDVVTARAFAPLPRIIEYAMPLFEGGALGLFLKGEDAHRELADAAAAGWSVRATAIDSKTDPRARILRIEGAARARADR